MYASPADGGRAWKLPEDRPNAPDGGLGSLGGLQGLKVANTAKVATPSETDDDDLGVPEDWEAERELERIVRKFGSETLP